MWKKIASFLGKLTDLLLKGREAGLYSENERGGVTRPQTKFDKPHEPGR